jgi:hypothetical protein
VLEIRHRRGGAAEHGRVEEATAGCEDAERDEPAADLEAPVGYVLVRDAVAGEVERRADQERERARADERADCSARRDVERDDHQCRYWPIDGSRH